jgi:tRNA modification GTPase
MDTLLACLTPPGKAAIATLTVRGPDAWQITRQLFQPHKGTLPETPIPGRYWFGRLGGDDVILAAKQDRVEIHCHGGVEVVRMITELFVQQGVKAAAWQNLVDESPALLDLLVRAPTTRTAAILLDQWQGAWTTRPRDLPRLNDLIPLAQHLVEPWKVVIAGAPNVGKSSLMNALAGYTRSIVSSIPGTTRDVVTTTLAIDGWPIDLSDTAGIRPTASALEQQGIKRTHDAARESDLRLWLLDGAAQPLFPHEAAGWVYLINKTDLPAAWEWEQAPQALRISAKTSTGLAELCDLISRRLVPHPPAPGEAVPCLPEQVEWVRSRLAPAESDE